MPAFNPPIGEPPSIELIPTARLMIDASYQRSIEAASSQRLIKRIVNDWDWRLCVPLLVSRREAGLFVIDGQHRLEGARQRGDIVYLPCCVSSYGSPADEAAIFVAANRKRRAVSRVDTFRAAILAGDPVAATIDALVTAAGFRLARFSSPVLLEGGELNCVSALERMLSRFGSRCLAAALRAIGEAFGDQVNRHASPIVTAACMILTENVDENEAAKLTAALKRRTPDGWFAVADAQPGGARGGQNAVWAMKRVIADSMATSAPPACSKIGEKRPLTFEEQLAAVANGAQLVERLDLRKPDPDYTLGGIGTAMIS